LIAQTLTNKEVIQNERLEKFSSDTKLELNDIKACVALVEFILKSAVKYNVNSETLSSELQQLGLPKGM
jgi:COMM domain containing 4